MSDYKDNEEINDALDTFDSVVACRGDLDDICQEITDAFEEGDKEKFEQLVKSYHKMFSEAESALSDILYQLRNESCSGDLDDISQEITDDSEESDEEKITDEEYYKILRHAEGVDVMNYVFK